MSDGETARSYMMTEAPALPGVYSVLVSIHGVQSPRAHEPELFAYWDGVDTWSCWEFSKQAAYRAKPARKSVRYGWRRNGPL